MPESQNYANNSNASESSDSDTNRGGELHHMDANTEQPDKSNHGNELEQISSLLRDGLKDTSEEDNKNTDDADDDVFLRNEEGTPTGFKKPPQTLDELAKGTGLKLEDLYNLAVPDGSEEGKTHTLSELKDAATKANGLEVRELQMEERSAEREATLTRQETELQELYNLIPKEFKTPELIEKIGSKMEAKVMREREMAMQKIPGWADENTRNQEIQGMVEHLADFGLPPSYLASVNDHRVLRLIRDSWARHERIKKTLAMVNEKFPESVDSKPNPKGKTRDTSKQTGPRQTEAKVNQISNLLRSGE